MYQISHGITFLYYQTPHLPNHPFQPLIGKSGRLYIRVAGFIPPFSREETENKDDTDDTLDIDDTDDTFDTF